MGILNYTTVAGSPPYNVQLYGPNGLIFNSLNNSGSGNYTPTLNGEYFIVVEDQAGCFADTVFYTIDFLSLIHI